MQTQSLVECITNLSKEDAPKAIQSLIKWLPTKNSIYTVRELIDDPSYPGHILVRLEEGEVGHLGEVEISITMMNFREVQPPIDISDAIEFLERVPKEELVPCHK